MSHVITIISEIAAVISAVCIIVKPIREKLFGIAKVNEGVKCLLRDEIQRTYYHHIDTKTLPRYSKESMLSCYEAYQALGGNSFVHDLVKEMREWEVR